MSATDLAHDDDDAGIESYFRVVTHDNREVSELTHGLNATIDLRFEALSPKSTS